MAEGLKINGKCCLPPSLSLLCVAAGALDGLCADCSQRLTLDVFLNPFSITFPCFASGSGVERGITTVLNFYLDSGDRLSSSQACVA